MAEEVDAKVLKQVRITQDLLGEFVKRPSLTEKHLMRPPYRYLHDIFLAVTEGTGFFRGIYTQEELNPAGMSTKEAKTAFLEKIVAVIEITSGVKLEIKTAKVLAGQEADKTNILLQVLAKCLQKKQSSDEAVKSVTGIDPRDQQQSKGGRRGSTSNEPAKVKSQGRNAAAAAPTQEPAKAKGKEKAGAGPSQQTNRAPTENATTKKSRETKPAAAAAAKGTGPYGKATPAKTGAAAPAAGGNKPKAGTRASPQDAGPTGSKGGTRAPGREREKAPVKQETDEDDNQKAKVSRSRRGSVGSPARSKTRNLQSDERGPQQLARRASIVSDDEQGQQQVGRKPSDAGSGSGAVGSQEIPAKIGGYPAPAVTAESNKSSTGFASGEDSDAGRESGDDNRANDNPPGSQYSVQNQSRPDPPAVAAIAIENVAPPVQPSSDAKPQRPVSRSSIRQRTEQQIREQQQERENLAAAATAAAVATGASNDQNENKSKPTPAPSTIGSRPPTSMKSRPPPSARPSSARPGAPRPRSALVVQVDENAFRPPTGKVLNVLMDNEELEDDADNYVVQELPPPTKLLEELDETPELALKGPLALGEIDSDVPESQRGLLLNQILQTQKELEGEKSAENGAGDSERVSHLRETTAAEVEKLQNLIQIAAKNAHPLGKLMDFIQEDVDSIHHELQKWQEESQKLDAALEEELAKTDLSLEPLRLELAQIEDTIQDQEDAIDATRMEIQQQETRIAKILSGFEVFKTAGDFNKTIQLPRVVKVFGMDVELNDEDRRIVFGDGSKPETMEQSGARSRPKSQYKIQRNINLDKLSPETSEFDVLGGRFKNLTSTSAKAREQPSDIEVVGVGIQQEQMSPAMPKRDLVGLFNTANSSPSGSPNLSPAQSLNFLTRT